jgi:hypothetical protein
MFLDDFLEFPKKTITNEVFPISMTMRFASFPRSVCINSMLIINVVS